MLVLCKGFLVKVSFKRSRVLLVKILFTTLLLKELTYSVQTKFRIISELLNGKRHSHSPSKIERNSSYLKFLDTIQVKEISR